MVLMIYEPSRGFNVLHLVNGALLRTLQMLWMDMMNPFGAQPGDSTVPPAPPAPPAPPLPQRCAGVAPLKQAPTSEALERQHWELLALQQEKNTMADTISALEAQVQQLQHEKTELENQRERLLAELDAGINSESKRPGILTVKATIALTS